jgi:DNA repair and recombination protein RAD54B
MCSARSHVAGGVHPGDLLNIAGKEIEIDHAIPPQDFISGKCFDVGGLSSDTTAKPLPASRFTSASAPFKPLIRKASLEPSSSGTTIGYPTHKSTGLAAPLIDAANVPVLPVLQEPEKVRHWTVQWRKPQTRKHKSWDGDGYVTQAGSKVTLFDEDGVMWVTHLDDRF